MHRRGNTRQRARNVTPTGPGAKEGQRHVVRTPATFCTFFLCVRPGAVPWERGGSNFNVQEQLNFEKEKPFLKNVRSNSDFFLKQVPADHVGCADTAAYRSLPRISTC